jgi:hypothetical protein
LFIARQHARAPRKKKDAVHTPDTAYPQGLAFYSARFGPAAYGAQLHCAASGQKKEAFKYKKGEWGNPLKLLDPKRQFQAVNRHDRSLYRQFVLALLSFNCHTPVC